MCVGHFLGAGLVSDVQFEVCEIGIDPSRKNPERLPVVKC
jgi:hypothetical protein